MNTLFIPTKMNIDVLPVVEKALPHLPQRVGIVTTIQHMHVLNEVKTFLEKHGKTAVIGGQLLGCNPTAGRRIIDDVDGFLFVGSGDFHPLGIILKENKRVIIADLQNNEIRELTSKDFEKYEKRTKAALSAFYASDDIGVIVSYKPGQENMKRALALEKDYPDKNFHIFICDTIDFYQLENFPFVQVWVNTACPRITSDDYEKFPKPVVNFEDIMPTNGKIESNWVDLKETI